MNAGRGGNAGLFQGSTTELLRMTACSDAKECVIKGNELVRERTEGTNGFRALEPASSAVNRPVCDLGISVSRGVVSDAAGEGVSLSSEFLEDDAIFWP